MAAANREPGSTTAWPGSTTPVWPPPRRLHPPPRGDLDAVTSEALLLIAVGEPLGPGELPAQVSPELLARMDAVGLVTTTLDGHRVVVRLVHHLFGEVLRAAASPLQLQKAHRDLVTAVQAHGSARRGDHLRLAHWSVVGQVDVESACRRGGTDRTIRRTSS